MSEFSPASGPKIAAVERPPVSQASGQKAWERPLLMGLSLPWLVGVVLVLVLAGWYLFAPEKTTTANRLAFQEDMEQQAAPAEGMLKAPVFAAPAASADSGAGLASFKNEVAAMVGGVRTYAEVNRSAIQRLADTVKAQSAAQQVLQQKLDEAQAQNSLLSARLSFLEGRPGAMTTTQRVSKPATKARSPLADMHVQALQNGMAWVYWQDKTWAVKAGDQLGQVTVNSIDAQAREVLTSAGTLK